MLIKLGHKVPYSLFIYSKKPSQSKIMYHNQILKINYP